MRPVEKADPNELGVGGAGGLRRKIVAAPALDHRARTLRQEHPHLPAWLEERFQAGEWLQRLQPDHALLVDRAEDLRLNLIQAAVAFDDVERLVELADERAVIGIAS